MGQNASDTKVFEAARKGFGRDEFSQRIFLIKVSLGLFLRRRKRKGAKT
jgi:hypothetical protein